jgi:hypothetical protein
MKQIFLGFKVENIEDKKRECVGLQRMSVA